MNHSLFKAKISRWPPSWPNGQGRAAFALLVALAASNGLPFAVASSEAVPNSDNGDQATQSKYTSNKASEAKEKLELGDFHLFNGNPRAAIKAYHEAAQLQPDLLEAHLNLADLYARIGNTPKAIEQCREVLRLKPQQQGINLLLGELLSAQNNLDEAIACFTRESELTGKSQSAESHLALALLAKDKNELSAAKFRELLGKDPNNVDFHLGLSMALSKLSLSDQALQEIDIALKYKPNCAQAHNLRGDLFYLTGQKEKAIQEYKLAMEDDKTFTQAYLSLGNLYIKEGKFQEGKDVFIQAAKMSPTDKDVLYGLAFSLEQSGEFRSALAVYERALHFERDPQNAATIKQHMSELHTARGHTSTEP